MDCLAEIDQYLARHRDEIVASLQGLVRIPSVLGPATPEHPYGAACAQALDYCAALCRQKGLVVNNYGYRCMEAGLTSQRQGRRLVLASHADVVPPDDENLYDPFGGELVGDYVVGRGVVDDKGPLIATLYALAFFKEQGLSLQNDVRLVFGSNEEMGMDDLPFYFDAVGQPDWGIAVDDDFPVVNGEKGLLRFIIQGKKAPGLVSAESWGQKQRLVHDGCTLTFAHGIVREERDAQGGSPLERALEHGPLLADPDAEGWVRRLAQDPEGVLLGVAHRDAPSGGSLLRLYEIHTQGDEVAFFFDLRLPVSYPVAAAWDALAVFGRNNGLSLTVIKQSPGYYLPENHPIVARLTDLYNRTAGACDKPYVMGACTYARLFERGCGFGGGNPHEVKPFPPGHGAAHGPDEAHSITVLLDAVRLYILGICAIDEYWGPPAAAPLEE